MVRGDLSPVHPSLLSTIGTRDRLERGSEIFNKSMIFETRTNTRSRWSPDPLQPITRRSGLAESQKGPKVRDEVATATSARELFSCHHYQEDLWQSASEKK